MRRYRPWIAALLSFLQPGLGHVYLRAWGRAAVWFAAWVGAVALLTDLPAFPSSVADLGPFLRAFATALDGVGLVASLALAALTALATLDAYWLASREAPADEDGPRGPRCPNCGKELDPDVSFCPWCAEEVEVWGYPPRAERAERADESGE